jgi:ABC-type multidrug transport system permease subunit
MMHLLLIIIASLVVGFLGSMKRIGFWGGFFASIVVTPLGGFLLVLVSAPAKPVNHAKSR